VLAKEYGQSPQSIEQDWDEWWLSRAIIDKEIEAEKQRRKDELEKRKNKARR
jgi:parvulin-like peptidyl-prolyl isomerase